MAGETKERILEAALELFAQSGYLGTSMNDIARQLGITKAYLCAPAKEISVYDYTQVIFAAALGFLVFGDVPDALSVLGYVLICGAGVGMYFYNNRKAAA